MTPRDAGQEFSRYIEDIPATLAATGWLALIGGGLASVRDIKNPQANVDVALRHWGFSAEQSRRIKAAATPEAFDATVREEMPLRTPGNIAAGRREAEAAWRQAEQEQADPAQPRLEAITRGERGTEWIVRDGAGRETLRTQNSETAQLALAELQQSAARRRGGEGTTQSIADQSASGPVVQKIVRPDGDEAWQVTDAAGQTREFATREEADAHVAKYTGQIDLQNITATRGVISFYEQLAQAEGRDVKFELSSLPKTVADAIAAKPESAGQLLDRMKIEGLEGADPAKVSILGETTLEQVQADLYQITIKLHEGATARTVIEETVEGKTREALAQGRISLDWLRSEVEAYQKATGEQLLTGTDQSVIEAVSTLGDAYFAGKVQDRALPGGLTRFFRQLSLLFKSAFTRALQLKKAVADGAVSQDFETFLADSVGIPTDRQIELNKTRERSAAPASTYSIGKSGKPNEPILSPTGHEDWAAFTAWDAWKSQGKIKPMPIRVLVGEEFGNHNGYGLTHIMAEHANDFKHYSGTPEQFIHRTLLGFNEVYDQGGGRLLLFSTKPTSVAVVELRNQGDHYSVVTAFPKLNPTWKPRGERILGGRRAAFAQSEKAPGLTAQEPASPKLPRETLPGKDSWEYIQYLSEPVKSKDKPLDTTMSIGPKDQSVLDQSKSLTYEDAANALRRDQQHPVFKALGSWFRGDFRKIQDDKMPEQTKILNEFFDRLPGVNTKKPLFRGIQFFNERDRDALVREMSGETWTNRRPFMSASKDPKVATQFSARSSYPMYIRIAKSISGRDIEPFGFIEPRYSWQKEVIFRQGAKFRVLRKPIRVEVDGKVMYVVELEEIQ